ncbi:MAG: carboxypeptidase-like regulatory domain-containing protein [Candidatus Stygibacter frigidus]|nr:carboxypeptidase-like regulatory domain-containing protein [Candidatus Stygibacter frigidus]
MKKMIVFLLLVCLVSLYGEITGVDYTVSDFSVDGTGGRASGEGYSEIGVLSSLDVGLVGIVSDQESSEGIEGAYIVLTCPGFIEEAESDAEGNYSFPGLNEGTYNLMATAEGYEQYNTTVYVEEGVNEQNIILLGTGAGAGSLIITDELTAYADDIEETANNVYTLSGNVSINNKLFYEGEIEIDKRAVINHPEISGNCAYGVYSDGSYFTLKTNNNNFSYYTIDDEMIPFNGFLNDLTFLISGFSVKGGIITFYPDYLKFGFVAELPYPVNRVFNYLEAHTDDFQTFIDDVSGAIHYYPGSQSQIDFDIGGLSANFGIFSINTLNLYYNSSEEIFGGGFKIKIPGLPEINRNEDDGDLGDVKVTIVDEEGNYRDETSLEKLIMMQRVLGEEFLELGLEMQFIQGALNTLVISISTQIPIGSTGLLITEMTGGVENLQSENWLILASVDIETGLSVPVLGPAVKLDDLAARIHPMNYFTVPVELRYSVTDFRKVLLSLMVRRMLLMRKVFLIWQI